MTLGLMTSWALWMALISAPGVEVLPDQNLDCQYSLQAPLVRPPLMKLHIEHYALLLEMQSLLYALLINESELQLHPHHLRDFLQTLEEIGDNEPLFHRILRKMLMTGDRVRSSLRTRQLEALRSNLISFNAALGELVSGFQVWGLEGVDLSSDELYPEKTNPGVDRQALRDHFSWFIGETDLLFVGYIGTELGVPSPVIGVGEVKTLLRKRALSRSELAQAARYANYAQKRSEWGQPVRVTYFFPLESPTEGSLRKLRAMGIDVLR